MAWQLPSRAKSRRDLLRGGDAPGAQRGDRDVFLRHVECPDRFVERRRQRPSFGQRDRSTSSAIWAMSSRASPTGRAA